MKKLFVLLLTAAALLGSVMYVLSDQNGTDKWCNTDEYGCWVTTEDGEQSYIYFWSEEARKYIMGDLSEPGSHVVDPLPASGMNGEGKMPLMDPSGIYYITYADATYTFTQVNAFSTKANYSTEKNVTTQYLGQITLYRTERKINTQTARTLTMGE